MKKNVLLLLLLLSSISVVAQKKSRKEYLVTLATDLGTMYLVLHDQTPQHKANFLKLAQQHFYDSLLFHRVIEGFMIQGGDPNSRKAQSGGSLGSGEVGYTVPAEFHPALFHRKGALAAARDNNPQKASSGSQFYLVQGKPLAEPELKQAEARGNSTHTEAQKKVYATEGGTPHLDGSYTVFGQVVGGLDVLDKIAAQPKNESDRPVKDVRMTVSVQKTKKRKITKRFGYQFE